MQVNEVNERIKVGVVFEGSHVTPKWFFWGRARHNVERVEHTWRSREGENHFLCFAVTAQSNVYQIRLDQKKLEWFLEKVYLD